MNFKIIELNRNFEPPTHQACKLVVSLISKRSNPILHSLINDPNHMFHCPKPRLVSSLIPLFPKIHLLTKQS